MLQIFYLILLRVKTFQQTNKKIICVGRIFLRTKSIKVMLSRGKKGKKELENLEVFEKIFFYGVLNHCETSDAKTKIILQHKSLTFSFDNSLERFYVEKSGVEEQEEKLSDEWNFGC